MRSAPEQRFFARKCCGSLWRVRTLEWRTEVAHPTCRNSPVWTKRCKPNCISKRRVSAYAWTCLEVEWKNALSLSTASFLSHYLERFRQCILRRVVAGELHLQHYEQLCLALWSRERDLQALPAFKAYAGFKRVHFCRKSGNSWWCLASYWECSCICERPWWVLGRWPIELLRFLLFSWLGLSKWVLCRLQIQSAED